jgi:SAM-dependent MidA family methyltransferase
VNAVERAAERAGLVHLGTTTQAEFLVGLGIEDLLRAIQADPATTLEAYLAVRSGIMRLLDPAATGRFRVLGFGREWPDGPALAGFAYRHPGRR